MQTVQHRTGFRDAQQGVNHHCRKHTQQGEVPAGEPQRGADQPAHRRRRQGHGDALHAGLHQQHSSGPVIGGHPRGELRCQPDNRGGGGEADGAQRPDDEAVQRLPGRACESHHHRGYQHDDRSADGHRDAHHHRQLSGVRVGQRYVVEARDQGAGRHRPSDTESDTEQCGGHQRTKGEVPVDVCFVEIEHEHQRKAERDDRDHGRLPVQQSTGDQQQNEHGEARTKCRAGPVRKVREQRTRHRQAHHVLAGRCRIRAHPKSVTSPVRWLCQLRTARAAVRPGRDFGAARSARHGGHATLVGGRLCHSGATCDWILRRFCARL